MSEEQRYAEVIEQDGKYVVRLDQISITTTTMDSRARRIAGVINDVISRAVREATDSTGLIVEIAKAAVAETTTEAAYALNTERLQRYRLEQDLLAKIARLEGDLDTALWSYGHLVEAVEDVLRDYIVEDDVAAPCIYHDAIKRAAAALPRWTFTSKGKYPADGQWVFVAYVDEDGDGEAHSCEAKWEEGEWHTNHVCLDITEAVYAWVLLPTPPREER